MLARWRLPGTPTVHCPIHGGGSVTWAPKDRGCAPCPRADRVQTCPGLLPLSCPEPPSPEAEVLSLTPPCRSRGPDESSPIQAHSPNVLWWRQSQPQALTRSSVTEENIWVPFEVEPTGSQFSFRPAADSRNAANTSSARAPRLKAGRPDGGRLLSRHLGFPCRSKPGRPSQAAGPGPGRSSAMPPSRDTQNATALGARQQHSRAPPRPQGPGTGVGGGCRCANCHGRPSRALRAKQTLA